MVNSITAITMPKLGLTMEEGTVTSWQAAEGEPVKSGQHLFDVETEKSTNECESPADGVLARIVAIAGVDLPVGALVGVIAPPDSPPDAIDDFIAAFHPETKA